MEPNWWIFSNIFWFNINKFCSGLLFCLSMEYLYLINIELLATTFLNFELAVNKIKLKISAIIF